jgi:hypothetical protein
MILFVKPYSSRKTCNWSIRPTPTIFFCLKKTNCHMVWFAIQSQKFDNKNQSVKCTFANINVKCICDKRCSAWGKKNSSSVYFIIKGIIHVQIKFYVMKISFMGHSSKYITLIYLFSTYSKWETYLLKSYNNVKCHHATSQKYIQTTSTCFFMANLWSPILSFVIN